MFARLMGLKVISPADLNRLVEQDQVTVIDVNSRESWTKAHVPGAANLDPVDYAPTDLPADKDAPIVFYCSGQLCRKAPNAAKRAEKLGYRNVKVMSAGITGWVGAKLPSATGA
ncbi:MAG: rhodanese-like domain-containing protein [Vicinamibacteria bacterium]